MTDIAIPSHYGKFMGYRCEGCGRVVSIYDFQMDSEFKIMGLNMREIAELRLRDRRAPRPDPVIHHNLTEFFRQIMHWTWDYPSDLDQGDVQDLALRLDLIRPVLAHGPCGDACGCADAGIGWPVECNRIIPELRGEE